MPFKRGGSLRRNVRILLVTARQMIVHPILELGCLTGPCWQTPTPLVRLERFSEPLTLSRIARSLSRRRQNFLDVSSPNFVRLLIRTHLYRRCLAKSFRLEVSPANSWTSMSSMLCCSAAPCMAWLEDRFWPSKLIAQHYVSRGFASRSQTLQITESPRVYGN